MVLIIGIGDNMKTYCYSQGIEAPFGYINLFNFAITIPLMYWFVFPLGMGVYGFVATRMIYEAMNFIMFAYVFLKHSDPKTIGKPSPVNLWPDFRKYFKGAIKFFVTNYFECLGFEINTVYASLLSDTTSLAAFVCWTNVVSIFFSAGVAIGFVMRTRINILFGRGEYKIAKNSLFWFVKYHYANCVIVGVLFFFSRFMVAGIYTQDPSIQPILSDLLTIY